ncbi:MAG: 1,4-dihydroxy-2-naphthoate polyprenyltransferase [Egibacteraceae bacterium]
MNVYVEAARPRTLPAAVAPVLVGTAVAQEYVAWRFLAAMVVGVAIQVGVNYANDYFDGVGGVDTAERVGPRRAVAAGLVTPQAMRTAMLAALGVAGLAGLALAAAVGWELLAVGVACIAAALGYSGGRRPYASSGLGELFVFVFFGLVATVGSTYVQDEAIVGASVVAGISMGLLATALLVVNNLRDIPTDRAAGKRTLAVRLGAGGTLALYQGVVVAAFFPLPLLAGVALSPWPLLAFAAAPLAVMAIRLVRRAEGPPDLVPGLAATAQCQLVFGLLLAAGLVVA